MGRDITRPVDQRLAPGQAAREREIRAQQQADARRVIGRVARKENWPAEESRQVLESLGLRTPVD